MNSFILNGIPKNNGHTAYLLDRVRPLASGQPTEFRLFQNPVQPCIDCGYCRTHDGCSIRDNMQDIYHCIDTSELVIIASPIYWSLPTPPVLGVLSRFQRYFSDDYVLRAQGPPKKGILVLTGGGGGGFEEAEKPLRLLLKLMNARHMGTIHSLQTDTLPAREDEAIEGQLRGLSRALPELLL